MRMSQQLEMTYRWILEPNSGIRYPGSRARNSSSGTEEQRKEEEGRGKKEGYYLLKAPATGWPACPSHQEDGENVAELRADQSRQNNGDPS